MRYLTALPGCLRGCLWGWLPVCVVACLAAMPAMAEDGPGTISTHATARARLVNTVADVTLGVEAHGGALPRVQSTLSEYSESLLAYLRGQKVERLRTEAVTFTPNTQSAPGQPDRIVGFDGAMRVSFRVTADRLGSVVAGGLEQGGNTVLGTALQPREEEVDAARQRLAGEAVKAALAEAKAVAEAAGTHLGAIRTIAVDYPSEIGPRPVMFGAARVAVPGAAMATAAGETEASATVSVVVGLAAN